MSAEVSRLPCGQMRPASESQLSPTQSVIVSQAAATLAGHASSRAHAVALPP